MSILALVLVAVATTTTAAAQTSPTRALTAPRVLANVQQHYARTKQLAARFRQIVTNGTFRTTTTSHGNLWVAKPDKFRWDYLAKKRNVVAVRRTFIFDGRTFSFIDHDNKQLVQSRVAHGTLPAAVSFLTGGGTLTSQFTVALNTTGTYGGPGAVVLELTPTQPSAQYAKLFFVVDPSDWHVQASIVIAGNGDTNTFELYAPRATAQVSTTLFGVTASRLPGYKVSTAASAGAAHP